MDFRPLAETVVVATAQAQLQALRILAAQPIPVVVAAAAARTAEAAAAGLLSFATRSPQKNTMPHEQSLNPKLDFTIGSH
jgi:hypothetical protein